MNIIEEKCKAKGVRLTDQRKIIAQVMSASKEKYGAKDSGASLGAILGKALGRNKSEE